MRFRALVRAGMRPAVSLRAYLSQKVLSRPGYSRTIRSGRGEATQGLDQDILATLKQLGIDLDKEELNTMVKKEREAEKEETVKGRAIKAERTYLGRSLLEPAWWHGRRTAHNIPADAMERIRGLTRLLSARQVRQILSKQALSAPVPPPQDPVGRGKKRKKVRMVDAADEDAVERWEEDEEEEEDAVRKSGPLGEYNEDDGIVILSATKPHDRLTTPSQALTYLVVRAESNYAVAYRALQEVEDCFNSDSGDEDSGPLSMLDVGCGPGMAMLAAKTIWPGLERIEGVDHSGAMLDLVPHIMGEEEGARVVLHRRLTRLASQTGRSGRRYDIVFSSYTLSELKSDAARVAAVDLMWSMLNDGGVLALVEEGSVDGSRIVRSARKELLQGSEPATTVGPCPHDKPCPLTKGDWCRFPQRVGGALQGRSFRDIAFSYVMMRKARRAAGDVDDEDDVRIEALRSLKQIQVDDGGDMTEPGDDPRLDPLWRVTEEYPVWGKWSRMIRTPKKAKGHVVMSMCKPDGSLEKRVVSRGLSRDVPGRYHAARKAQWGGLWPTEKI